MVYSSVRYDVELKWRSQILIRDYVAEGYLNNDSAVFAMAFDTINSNDAGSPLGLTAVTSSGRRYKSDQILFFNTLESANPTQRVIETTGYATGFDGSLSDTYLTFLNI